MTEKGADGAVTMHLASEFARRAPRPGEAERLRSIVAQLRKSLEASVNGKGVSDFVLGYREALNHVDQNLDVIITGVLKQ